MRVRLSSFVLTALVGGSTLLYAADRPPQDLHLVDGHWTAWNPPATAAGEQVHVIVRGDTLWDLAGRYYGNPYLWPQLWERNQYILDAHWIYPGDPLVLGPQVAPVDNLAGGSVTGTGEPGLPGDEAPPSEPIPGVLNVGEAAGAPVPLGFESDIYCSGYVGELEEEFPYSIVGSEYEVLSPSRGGTFGRTVGDASQGVYGATTVKYALSTGDIVYLDGGRSRGLSAGLLFTAVEPARPILSPLDGEVMGRLYRYQGRVRVLSVQEDTAIAEIVHSCDSVLVGARLMAFEPEPVPLGRPTGMRPVNFPAAAEKLKGSPMVVYAKDDILALGEDHIVHINVGEDQDVTPGDIFTIYRENRPGLPPVVLGELAVLSVHPRFSVAKIIESRYAVHLGDRIDLK